MRKHANLLILSVILVTAGFCGCGDDSIISFVDDSYDTQTDDLSGTQTDDLSGTQTDDSSGTQTDDSSGTQTDDSSGTQMEALCNGRCNSYETCINEECLCGEQACQEDEQCIEGTKCQKFSTSEIPNTGDDDEKDDQSVECTPACTDNMECVNGKCQVKPKECTPKCTDNQYCDSTGTCQNIVVNLCGECAENESCTDGSCKCGTAPSCNTDEKCDGSKCVPLDPCKVKTCLTGQICEKGECVDLQLTFNAEETDVMLSSDSKMIIVNKPNSDKLTWTIVIGGNEISSSQSMSKIKCKIEKGKYSMKLDDCIKYDDAKHTESIQFLGFTRHATTMELKVKDEHNNKTASMKLNLKPYFDFNNFVKISGLVYRNNYCAGHKLVQSVAGYDYSSGKETDDMYKANLGGRATKYAANPYAKTYFDDTEAAIFDKDMYTQYILPHMIKHNGKYYGTRASVVAAARFLILQFPYDIPYTMKALSSTQLITHYTFSEYSTAVDDISKTRIYGLNLTSNAYNSSLNHDPANIIRKTAVAWGDAYIAPSTSDPDLKYPYSGLECSGFVSWALNNGRVELGDWKTRMFAKDGKCKIDGKLERNYKCANLVNTNQGFSNQNNKLIDVYTKLNLLQDSDFIDLQTKDTTLSTAQLKNILRDVKAGDILWRGAYDDSKKETYGAGHIAMIIGLKRDNSGNVTEIEIGEATINCGNTLTRKTPEELRASSWFNAKRASFIIKMDRIYNYNTDINNIKTESAKSDCADGKKSGGNCYDYTDSYNSEFNNAITRLR